MADAQTLEKTKSMVESSMKQVFADWETMSGAPIALKASEVQSVAAAADLGAAISDKTVLVQTQIDGDCHGPLVIAFPPDLVISIVGAMSMLPKGVIDERAKTGLIEADYEGFREMANLLCGSSTNVLQALKTSLRVSQSVDHLRVAPASELKVDEVLPGALVQTSLKVGIGPREFAVHHLISDDLATDVAGHL